MSDFAGIRIIRDRNMPAPRECRQVRFPRTKKRRIRKKWSRRMINWAEVTSPPVYYQTAHGIRAHPDAVEMLLAKIGDEVNP